MNFGVDNAGDTPKGQQHGSGKEQTSQNGPEEEHPRRATFSAHFVYYTYNRVEKMLRTKLCTCISEL